MVRTYAGLHALPRACRALLEAAGEENFFLGPAWFESFSATMLEPGAQARVYAVEDSRREPTLLLIARTPAGQNGSMLRCGPLSSRTLAGLTNYQTTVYGPIVRRDAAGDRSPFEELARHLASERPRWEVLDFNYLDASAPGYPMLVEALAGQGLRVKPYFHCNSWFETTSGRRWNEYLKDRSPSAHKALQNYARKERKLARSGSIRHEIFSCGDIDPALRDYQTVYAASWKGPEPFPQFLPRVLSAAAAEGALRLGILYYNDEPVATEVAILSGGRATMVKTAYDERFKDYSAGSIIIRRVMEHLLDVDRVREVEFGPFDQPYKSLWVSQRRPLAGVAAFNTRALHGLYNLAYDWSFHAARGVRDRLRQPRATPAITK